MKLKSLAISSALALAASLATTPVTAAPLSFSQAWASSASGAFSYSNTFNVTGYQTFDIKVQTESKQKDILVDSIVLSKGAQSYTFDLSNDGTSFAAGSWFSVPKIEFGRTVTYWDQIFDLSDILLTAGTWSLTVNGRDINDKAAGGYVGTANAVPEPQTLALVLGGLLGAAALRRRRAAR